MIKDERNNKLKIVVIHGVSAIFIVLLWFMLYYFFQNHGWQCSSKEECLRIHQEMSWEFWNDTTFCIVYFLIDVVNCRLTGTSFWNYALVHLLLDSILFFACMMFMEKIAWFVPITGVNGFDAKYTRIKAIIHYGLQYNGAFWFSYAIMAMIYGIRILMKKLKEK